MDVFQSMLLEVGIDCGPVEDAPVPEPLPLDRPQSIAFECCGEVLWYYANGFLTCPTCGLVHDQGEYLFTLESWKENEPCGSRQSMVIERKRFYRPLNHFKEHLRRYMGIRFTRLPDHLLTELQACSDVDVHHPEAYFMIKKQLKQRKLSKLYKEIFTIIYALGGQRPQLTNAQYHGCIRTFTLLMQVFERKRADFGRHSMPSMYVMLDQLLRSYGHTPFYTIPLLKNTRLLKNVYQIIQDLIHDGGVGRLV